MFPVCFGAGFVLFDEAIVKSFSVLWRPGVDGSGVPPSASAELGLRAATTLIFMRLSPAPAD